MRTRFALAAVLAACAHEPSLGSERDPCRAGSACDPGLTCLSDRCVVVPATPATAPLAGGSGGSGNPTMPLGLPPECVAYVAALDHYAVCAKLPAEARTSIQNVIAQLKLNWAGLGSAAMPAAVGDACRQGTAAIRQAMISFGC